MRKRFLLLLFLVSQQVSAFCQAGQDVIPKVIPPSPGAAALEKFSSIPVDYSTGVPSISYPIWSWQRGRLQFSMGLSYHAGGHKVDDMSSNVGLGWALTGVGRISRTVRGIPDDNPDMGFMHTDSLPNLSTYAYNGDEYYYSTCIIASQAEVPITTAVTVFNSPLSGAAINVVNSQMDGEQDLFSYSFGGGSGRFVIDKNHNIIPLEHTNTKIEMLANPVTGLDPSSDGRILSFKITDDKGVVYKFDYPESQGSVTYSNPEPFPPAPSFYCTSGWLLTKIIDPTTHDSIIISYDSSGLLGGIYETGFSENLSQTISNDNSSGFSAPSITTSYQGIATQDLSPVRVLFPDSSTLNFEYIFERDDLDGSHALSKIKAKNYDNTVVKWLQLKHSYFLSGDGTAFPGLGISDNDYSKRLRLDSIIEISSDSTLFKPTVYTYDPTLLNARGSKNIDYWGYNVNPARNNLQYAPMVPTTGSEYGLFGIWYLDGANRAPDSVYSKAAILTKIKYPTGGFSSFEYESNKVYSIYNYYVDRLITDAVEWDEDTFGDNFTIGTLPGRNEDSVEFHFSAVADPEGTAQDNDPPVCFENGQDDKLARFIIKSTDNNFTDTLDCTYKELMSGAGVSAIFSLPFNKTYQVKLLYDHEASCAFLYPFKASAVCKYYIYPEAKLAGGLRIKKITTDDGGGNLLTKTYNYNNPDGRSSAVFASWTNVPNYGYYRVAIDESVCPYYFSTRREINRSSNPTNTMGFNGAPLVYTKVTETERDGSATERYYDPLVLVGGDPTEFPYLPMQDCPNLSGMMIKQIIKDNTGTVKRLDTVTYNKVINQLPNIGAYRNIKGGVIARATDYPHKYYAVDRYFMFTTRAEAVKDSSVIYENGNTLTNVQTKTYDPSIYYLRTAKSLNSKNEEVVESYVYSGDEMTGTYSSMADLNMKSYMTQKTVTYGSSGPQLSMTLSDYDFFQSSTMPMPVTIQSSIGGNTLKTDITFNEYDDKGNLLQYTAKDGVVTSFIWGYKKQYPVAKIIGKPYWDAITESGLSLSVVDKPSSDAAMRTELNKLRSLSNCFVTTLTYKPLVGTTSETDPNGKTIYYVYDAFNRLSLIRDKDNYILKKFCYNYTGQPVICGQDTVAAWTAISSVCDTSSGGIYTGYMTVTEKNLSPASATYGQTRTRSVSNGVCVPLCVGEGKKLINGICTTGGKLYTSSVWNGSSYTNTYYYIWIADCSMSEEYTETSAFAAFILEPPCP